MLLLQLQEIGSASLDASKYIYRVDVKTGNDFGAGTDANIFCILVGEHARSSGEFHLADSLKYVNKFERGQVGVI